MAATTSSGPGGRSRSGDRSRVEQAGPGRRPGRHAPIDMRASNADREPVVERVKDAFVQGRLDEEEFDHRLSEALSARTHAELAAVLRDLPPPAVPPPWAAAVAAPAGAAPPVGGGVPPSERMSSAAGHLAGVLTSFVGPLVLYLLVDRRWRYARRQLAEAVNFQLTLLLVTMVTMGLGGIVYAVAWIVSIVAGARALDGHHYRYPLTLRILR